MSAYAFDRAGGQKLRMTNLVPRPSDIAAGAWYPINYAWGIVDGTDPWNNWLRPQIDAALTVGANCCRFMFDDALRVSTYGPHLTAGQFQTIMAQMANYLALKGMWFYPVVASTGANAHNASYGMTLADLQSYITECVAYMSTFVNVIGFDVIQEIDYPINDFSGFTYVNMTAILTTAHAAVVNGQPCTCSLIGANNSGDITKARGQNIIDRGGDFADYHVYYTGSASDFDVAVFNALAGAAGASDWPTVIGEIGINNADGSTAVTNRYDFIVALANRARLQMVGTWAATDFSVAPAHDQDWGMFTNAWAARTIQTTRFATMPKIVQPYNAAEDAFAVVESAPSISIVGTTATLAWAAAVGGSGTITYTPQYVETDANGFPTQAWHSASTTTATGCVITGLTGPFSFRIKSSGAPAGGGSTGITYSPWGSSIGAGNPSTVAWRSV